MASSNWAIKWAWLFIYFEYDIINNFSLFSDYVIGIYHFSGLWLFEWHSMGQG
jgi:hypothetical protein